ncbi:MAG: lipopolysaccharide biosynthesis protein [Aeoliella sp.]
MTSSSKSHTSGIRPDTLLASVAVLLAVNVVQRSIGFGRGVLFCRWLDPEALGQWDMAYGFLLLAAPIVVLGLPGCFGRYLERYRGRGQLRTFLVRTCVWTGTLTFLAVSVLLLSRRPLAHLVFGDPAESLLLAVATVTLAMVILHHFLEAVFAGLRLFRVVSFMQFAQSMLFAVTSLMLLALWRADAWSIVVGYGAACLLSSIGVLMWSRRLMRGSACDSESVAHREFWPPLLKFAAWVWVANVLANLFSVIDRYMIVHYSGLPADEALTLVGYYHTSMLVPILLISVANLLAGAMTPHLSHDWEAGQRASVAARINLTFKLTSLAMFAAGIGVLLFTPTLFHLAFGGKYDDGLLVLPWALASCVWFSLLLVSQTYVWCAEKTRRAALPLAVGLVGNVLLNLLLLPRLGLQGAVIATALATLLALVMQLLVNRQLGMKLSIGTLLASLTPFGLSLSAPLAIASGSLLVFITLFTPWFLDREERREIVDLLRSRLLKLTSAAALTGQGKHAS